MGAPHWKPNVRGAIFGLTRDTSISEIVKATLDSISYQTLELIERMEKDAKIRIKEIRVDGGMSENNNLMQSISNTLQIKIIKPLNSETTALGAAYLAGLESGRIKDIKTITKLSQIEKTYIPQIRKFEIKKKILKWRKVVKFLIKYHS